MSSAHHFIDFRKGDVIIKSICEEKNVEISYVKTSSETEIKRETSSRDVLAWNKVHAAQSLLRRIFLPRGFPDSVSSDYLEYQMWDTCQAFCSSISGTLSMSAIMKSVGVGSQTATPASAAVTWIMKDGTGMIGSIIFAWSKGSKLDSDCKKWRLFADILNDAAMCLELYLPYVMDYSMFILCLSTTMKALVGVAGSATRAALTCHQAINGNMADVSAKDGSQEIFVNLFAYLFGIFLLKNVTESNKIWAVMCTFILLHLFFNYKAVSCLKINVYNGERYRLSLRSFLVTSDVPTIVQVNRNESVFLGRGTSNMGICGFNIHLGVSLERAVVIQKLTPDDLSFLVYLFQSRNYIVFPYVKRGEILVSFRRNITEIDVLKAYFHAILTAVAIKVCMQNEKLVAMPLNITGPSKGMANKLNCLMLSKKLVVLMGTGNILRTNEPPRVGQKRNQFQTELVLNPVESEKFLPRKICSSKRSDVYRSKALPVQALLSCDEVIEREFALFSKLSSEQGWNLQKHLILVGEWTAEWKYVDEKRVRMDAPSKNSLSKYQRRQVHELRVSSQQQVPKSKAATASKGYVNYMGMI